MKLISACLLGIRCQYTGKSDKINLSNKLDLHKCIPVCAEQLGGLPTPRIGSGIFYGTGDDVIRGKCKVLNKKGKDVTKQFLKGADEVLKIAKRHNVNEAILRDGSPACGINKTWQMRLEEGKYRNYRVDGAGVLGALLKKEGIKLTSHKELIRKWP